ncbi:hypothetical protein ACFO5K_25860 [Nocardia halotolerans]|uniref:Colicin import membrane protein n=1 Tax=Nocardia halotolerans TaxID=1755878 RepID=A0ABV8VPA7_9NOCA
MTHSPIEDLVADHLRRVRMLRVEFEDERARLQAKGDELLAAARAAEERAAAERAAGQLAAEQLAAEQLAAEQLAAEQRGSAAGPQPFVDIDAARREEQLREATTRAAAEQARAVAAENAQWAAARAAEQPPVAEHAVAGWRPVGDPTALQEDELRAAREAIARSAAARRAAERVEPVDYDGYDQESEYFRRKDWFS